MTEISALLKEDRRFPPSPEWKNFANITDPYMGRIELAVLPPDSLHYNAIESWK